MHKPDGYNSPKGIANNAQRQQGPATGPAITTKVEQPVAKPVMPAPGKAATKDQEKK